MNVESKLRDEGDQAGSGVDVALRRFETSVKARISEMEDKVMWVIETAELDCLVALQRKGIIDRERAARIAKLANHLAELRERLDQIP